MSPVFTYLLSILWDGTIEVSRVRDLAPDLFVGSHGSRGALVLSKRPGKAVVDFGSNFSSPAGRGNLTFGCTVGDTAAIALVLKEEDGL